MPIRADNDPRYSRRFLFMGIVAIGFSLWCLKDAVISYPESRERGFAEFKSQYPHITAANAAEFEANADTKDWIAWQKLGHDLEFKTRPEIIMQYFMAAVSAGTGLFLLSIPLRARGRWIEASESGITSSWGQSLQYDQVEQVNKRKWRQKGIANVTYIDNGRRKQFVIDDFKFMRERTDQILFELEQRIEVERITGGPPEPLPEELIEHPLDAASPTSADEPS
jgi:hypothetical protein